MKSVHDSARIPKFALLSNVFGLWMTTVCQGTCSGFSVLAGNTASDHLLVKADLMAKGLTVSPGFCVLRLSLELRKSPGVSSGGCRAEAGTQGGKLRCSCLLLFLSVSPLQVPLTPASEYFPEELPTLP